MSWQDYVDSNLIGSKKVTHAAILGRQGGVWSISAGIKISKDEENSIISALKNRDTAPSFRVAGNKYFFLSADSYGPDSSQIVIQGKQKSDGAVLVQTRQAILVVLYVFPQTAQEAGMIGTRLGSYLVELNY